MWDSGILAVRDPDAQHYAERLNAWLTMQPDGAFHDGSVVEWAMESHDIAKETCQCCRWIATWGNSITAGMCPWSINSWPKPV